MPSSRPNHITGRTGRTRAATRAFVAALALAALAAPAGASKVVDVRVGLHKSFTRVVLETDAPTKYRIERGSSGVIYIHLDADASSRRVSTRSRILREVRLVPGQDQTIARLKLRDANVKIQELILLDPPRIVLDLRPTETLKAGTAPATEAPEHPKTSPPVAKPPTPTHTPESLAQAAEDEAAKQRAALAAERQAAREKAAADAARAKEVEIARAKEAAAAKAAEAARQKEAEQAARAVEIAERLKAAEAESLEAAKVAAQRKAAALAEAEAALEAEAAEALGEADTRGLALAPAEPGAAGDAPEGSIPAGDRSAETIAEATAPEAMPSQVARPDQIARAVPPQPSPSPASRPSPDAQESAPSGSGFSSFLRDPVVLGALGLAIALGIGIVIHQRRSGREDELISPVGDDDQPFSFEEGATDQAESSYESAGELPSADESVYVPVPDVAEASGEPSEKDEEAKAVNTEIGMDSMDTSMSPPPGVGANADMMRMVQELERRLTIVEKRLEETTEAKERLERQVAAQTEELRVQRSAIARTQRALRSIARPEDEATEPVPKG